MRKDQRRSTARRAYQHKESLCAGRVKISRARCAYIGMRAIQADAVQKLAAEHDAESLCPSLEGYRKAPRQAAFVCKHGRGRYVR